MGGQGHKEKLLVPALRELQASSADKADSHEAKRQSRASLVAQWLRIRLPMQGTQVRALVQEDPTCRRATKPVHHNY